MYWQIYSVLLLCVTSSFAMNQEANASDELDIEKIFNTYCKPKRYSSHIVPINFCVNGMKNSKDKKIQGIYKKLVRFNGMEYVSSNILSLIDKNKYPRIPDKCVEEYNKTLSAILHSDTEQSGIIYKSKFIEKAQGNLDEHLTNVILSYFVADVFNYEEHLLKIRQQIILQNSKIINWQNIKHVLYKRFLNED
ncbi:uncharacterized protein LOC126907678 [Daktulosphaira vitifoliae]|uniref:uncharacterized protein LOC126907678 n=1 Tax=Daktulosphaira vitifoliae TaxID=58002 RepID=UPI0021AAF273|nr:uncharacterized protein LOC126907678 [Daktulosphaira vitifoliae]